MPMNVSSPEIFAFKICLQPLILLLSFFFNTHSFQAVSVISSSFAKNLDSNPYLLSGCQWQVCLSDYGVLFEICFLERRFQWVGITPIIGGECIPEKVAVSKGHHQLKFNFNTKVKSLVEILQVPFIPAIFQPLHRTFLELNYPGDIVIIPRIICFALSRVCPCSH